MKEDILLIGAGGHCRSCIEVIESTGRFNIVGILDSGACAGSMIYGYPILGADDQLPVLRKTVDRALITVGSIENTSLREKLHNLVATHGYTLPMIAASSAHVSKHAAIGDGTIIMHHALINAGAKIGINCIINSGSIIEHDCSIGDHTHVSTNACINGNCSVGERCFIGSGSVIRNGISVCSSVVIGAGSTVVASIDAAGIYYGNPARVKS